MTPLKQSMIETSMNSVALFIKELPYAGFDRGILVKVEGNWVCKNEDLYCQYLAWCATNNQKSFKDNIFFKNIPKDMCVKKGYGRKKSENLDGKTTYKRFHYTQLKFEYEIGDDGKFILDDVKVDDVDE
jgi:phage/plasmid-associated DNA primase